MNITDLNNMKIIGLTDRYTYNGVCVPRVTEILSKTIHEDYLMGWANHLGFKRKNYKSVIEEAANIGTVAHEAIENFLKHNLDNPFNIPLKGFKMWWNIVSKRNPKILGQEQKLVCQYFGGTYDLLIEIDGRNYLVDFKTSNHLSYKYCLQLAAYNYMLNHSIDIHGIIILQLDKKVPGFEEFILDFSNKDHLDFFLLCQKTFLSLVYSYYHILEAERLYKNLNKEG